MIYRHFLQGIIMHPLDYPLWPRRASARTALNAAQRQRWQRKLILVHEKRSGAIMRSHHAICSTGRSCRATEILLLEYGIPSSISAAVVPSTATFSADILARNSSPRQQLDAEKMEVHTAHVSWRFWRDRDTRNAEFVFLVGIVPATRPIYGLLAGRAHSKCAWVLQGSN